MALSSSFNNNSAAPSCPQTTPSMHNVISAWAEKMNINETVSWLLEQTPLAPGTMTIHGLNCKRGVKQTVSPESLIMDIMSCILHLTWAMPTAPVKIVASCLHCLSLGCYWHLPVCFSQIWLQREKGFEKISLRIVLAPERNRWKSWAPSLSLHSLECV